MQIPKDRETFSIKVIPRARKTEYVGLMDDGSLKIRLHAVPEDGRANRELLEFLERETGERWEIVSGWTNLKKVIKLIDN